MGTNITGIGNANAIGFKSRVTGGIYFSPELKDALVGVWSAYGKSNDSTDRNIIKNKIKDRGGDFVISNAAFKLNSGFGGFVEDFTSWDRIDSSTAEISNDGSKIKCINTTLNVQYLFNYINRDISSFKVKISNFTKGDITYYYRKEDGIKAFFKITPLSVVNSDKVIELPKSYNTVENGTGSRGGFYSSNINIGVTIEQIPSFEGAFVTDGIDDLITSTKTVQEMLGGSNEITVVSMIHQIDGNVNYTNGYTNYIRHGVGFIRSVVAGANGKGFNKTGIYGYTSTNLNSSSMNLGNIVNNILGDKDDYSFERSSTYTLDDAKYSVQNFVNANNQPSNEGSSIAWYWTIIANKVLTTDQINQVIAYFNLDRTLKPDILCNTIKQGITNENHAEFGDKLIDFSGNGRDIQLNNLAWDGDSGIGKYNYPNWKVTATIANMYSTIVNYPTVNGTYSINVNGVSELMQSIGLPLEVKYTTSTGIIYNDIKQDGVYSYILPDGATNLTLRFGGIPGIVNEPCNITITQIPSHVGALCLDGVNDFGKVTGLPIYKDYTVVADRELFNAIGCVLSNDNPGAFIFETSSVNVYSFGEATTSLTIPTDKQIRYQTKYSYNGQNISIGTVKEGTSNMWLGTIRDNDARFRSAAIYSLMTFPYSMSEFLIERQLKKHKLGTLYPDMVEFRPVIKSNASYDSIVFYYKNEKVENGTYLTVGSSIGMHIRLSSSPVNEIKSITVNGIPATFKYHDANNNIYQYDFNLTSKSPQKINITIDEYIRFEDIVQPYPVLLRFNDENGNEVSWGGKFKVGSTITRIGSAADSNLLPNIYNIFGLLLNGNQVTSSKAIVEKTMVFKAKSAYIFDNNEPNCILSPRLLSIPNSSYKILGYIPDISGNGNHGVIHNSAYAEGSGVNEDGSYQFDGVDDFVTIPTLSSGGKQVLMKVNSRKSDCYLYDQRNNWTQYLGIVSTKDFIAYNYSNQRGKTYIDGILNENITANDLIGITHNITVTNNRDDVKQYSPCIGTSFAKNSYAQMALYDFMLFDEISTDDKIKELNEYVGIEAKVELPPYYWDTYGKTNSDADRDTIQQRGVAVGDYDLINYNHAYEGMSGYNGYPVVFGANKTWESLSDVYGYTSDVTNTTIHVTHTEHAGNGLLFRYVKKDGALTNIKEIPAFRVTVKGLEGNSKFGYRYLATEDATIETLVYLGNGTHELAKSFAPTEALLDLTRNVWVGIFITPMVEGEVVFDCDITIEVLPEYENGLAYDGITDYSKNANIPVLTDYTYIYKRTIINIPTNAATLLKGADKTNGGAFIADYGNKWQFNFGQYNTIQGIADGINWQTVNSFNGTSINKGENTDDSGITVAKFSNGYTSMVFYKLILYPKTISLLEINFLKNLMEKDEIIDLNNPIFIKNE